MNIWEDRRVTIIVGLTQEGCKKLIQKQLHVGSLADLFDWMCNYTPPDGTNVIHIQVTLNQ